jgi:LAS superfamily LD-carboxypeptidase LdcB
MPATCSAPLPAPGTTSGPVNGAWGGWSNGQIPADQLCSLGGGHRLRCDAAAAYNAMSAAYAATFGSPLCITDSYRSLDAQVDAHHRKPKITAVPGTSNHGWGLAVDLCGGINVFGTAQTAWMQVNAAHYGWLHPDWARAGGQNPEPWHWEYGSLT